MKTLIISGSRNPEGQTAQAAGAFLEGIRAAGGEGEIVFLPEMTVERCRQCDADGWGICRSEGRCVIDDDFAGLVDRARNADLVCFATPVYFGDLSESMKAFIDRLRRICRHENGKRSIAGTPAAGICVAGGGGGGSYHCCVCLERALGQIGMDTVDLVPVRRQNLEMKKDVLRATGRHLART
jgi:multimeric flavodoxin WrbA